MGFYTKVLLIL